MYLFPFSFVLYSNQILRMKITSKVIFLSLILACTTSMLFSQEAITKENASSRSLKGLEDAEEAIAQNDLPKALNALQKVLSKEPTFVDALFLRGSVFYDQKHYKWAEGDFEMALKLAPDYNKLAWFQLAVIEWRLKKYEESAEHFDTYLKTDHKNDRQRQIAQEYLEKARFASEAYAHAVPFDPVRLNDFVNTTGQEYLPALTADGKTLIFTAVVQGQEDFFMSEKVDGDWTARKPLEGVNTRGNEGAQSISADGKFLVFTACQRRDSEGRCDLYFTEQIDGEWQTMRNIGQPINTASWESQPSISANRDQLFFASDRKGGVGKKDLWVSNRLADGSWGNPLNLGNQINTKGDDKAPFIHPDGKTLYFMSDGHPGLGGFDLFYSRLDENGQWGKPVNLGHPINTEKDEGLMIISLDGKTAYFSTDRNAKPQEEVDPNDPAARLIPDYDIFSFELYEAARPSAVTYVTGTVVDAVSGEALQADFSISALNGKKNWVSRATDQEGQFLAVLPAGEEYSLHVTKEGYAFYSDYFDLAAINTIEEPFELMIELQPLSAIPDLSGSEKAPIRLNNIFFETGSVALLDASETELQVLLNLLDSNPGLKIEVHGHTDNVGSEEDNLQLSEGRAKAVIDYLQNKGVAADRLSFRGFGESAPIAPNDTAEGRRQNRRTEFIILN